MAVGLTWYNTLVDDSGGGTDGTILDKADFAALIADIDAGGLGALTAASSSRLASIAFATTQVPSGDANTLDDYKEMAWTITDASGAGLTFTSVSCSAVKLGQLAVAGFELVFPSTANGSAARFGGLPWTVNATPSNGWAGVVGYTDSAIDFRFLASGTSLFPYKTDGSQPTNANLSLKSVRGVVIYRASA